MSINLKFDFDNGFMIIVVLILIISDQKYKTENLRLIIRDFENLM